MKTFSQVVHQIMGSKPAPGAEDVDAFRCWVCAGEATRGALVQTWMGCTFVGQNRVRCPSSLHVCEACITVMSGRPPDTLRMWSVLVDGATMSTFNKGQKPAIREFLRREHAAEWGAAIADSGQKHVVPWTPVNPPGRGGSVLLEETMVTLPRDDRGWSLIDEMTALLTAGASKEGIGSGDYTGYAYERCAQALFAFERARERERGSPWFDLALWLSQRDEAEVAKRLEEEKVDRAAKKAAATAAVVKAPKGAKKEATRAGRKGNRAVEISDSRRAAGGAGIVPLNAAGKRPEALGSDSVADQDSREDQRGGGGLGHIDRAWSSTGGTQCPLFGGDDGPQPRGARSQVRVRVPRPGRA